MNVDVACPQCGTQYSVKRELLGRRSKCAKCGNAFVLSEAPQVAAPVVMPEPPSTDPVPLPEITVKAEPVTRARPQPLPPPPAAPAASNFWALRLMARSYEVFALIALAGILVPLTLMIYTIARFPTLAVVAVVQFGMAVIGLLFSAMMLLLTAQFLRLELQVEQNTRETSEACRQLAEHLCSIESVE